ncbi:hypothetical protein ACFQL1_12955 [Halomicroarcula sp. GCM10025709]|uniref:hypothetical protein n=1 Tax=Haloarcula TaxID=2237 RepID=UPI0024C3BD42|nr:hypothetical protein [Halomicroarcula sp. YJ-61-S]
MIHETSLRKLFVVVSLAGMLTLAGCSGGTFGLGGGGGSTPPATDQVPADINAVVHVDMAITDDATTQAIVEAGAESASATAPSQPENVSEARDQFQSETGLDPQQAEEMVFFQRRSESGNLQTTEYAGVILHANWETDAAVESFRNDSQAEYEETSYNGQTVYRPTEASGFGSADWFAVLGDGQFVFGSEAAVKDTIDVTAGDGEAFGGDLRSAYDGTRDGLVTFATTVPQEQIPESSGGQVDTGAYRNVEIVTGVYYTSSNSAGMEMQMLTASESSATDVSEVTDGAASLASGYTQNETAKEALRNIEVTQDGSTVTVTYEDSVDTLQAVLRYLYEG